MIIKDLLLKEFDQETASTRKILAVIPAGHSDWKPHEKSMTLGRLAGHTAEIPGWGVTVLEMDTFTLNMADYKPFVPQTAEEAVKRFNEDAAKFRAVLAAETEEHLATKWEMIYGGKVSVSSPRVEVLRNFLYSHLVHHRAQLGVYLRLLNVPIPGVYGPSADDKQMMSAA